MQRRQFIKQSTATLGLLSLSSIPMYSFEKNNTKHITILHTNDVHSHIDPFPANDSRNPNQGGVARRASLIQQIRQENPHTLLLDAGDIFQGTPYFNFYGGELEIKLMSMMGYDAATIGNHDFDNAVDGLYAQMPHATFQFLSANYDFTNTVMNGHVKPYSVFVKDGVKIGVFGLGIELAGLVDPRMYKETKYLDPLGIAQDMSRILKTQEKCDLVICLSHLGYQYKEEKMSDLKLAGLTQDIDLIIGGHTHTFLKKPTVTKNAIGKNVLVNQVGFAGLNLGRIDFYLDEAGNVTGDGVSILV
jgi:5'-nucleotidase